MAEFMGKDGFVWWQGVVEDRYDPLYLGRCKIRILGWHTEDKTDMPTESLPWAYPVQPIISAAQTGVGISPTGPVEGTWVVGFYRDGEQAQEPVFFGTLGGIPSLDSKIPSDKNEGFSDPRGDTGGQVHPQLESLKKDAPINNLSYNSDNPERNIPYPPKEIKHYKSQTEAETAITPSDPDSPKNKKILSAMLGKPGSLAGAINVVMEEEMDRSTYPRDEYLGESTTPREARGKFGITTNEFTKGIHGQKMKNYGLTGGPTGFKTARRQIIKNAEGKITAQPKGQWKEPQPDALYGAVYPYNHVHLSESGHLIEVDDTPNNERLHRYHRTGTYEEIGSLGQRVIKVVNENFHMGLNNDYTSISGSKYLNITNTLDIVSRGGYYHDSGSGPIEFSAKSLNMKFPSQNFSINNDGITIDAGSSPITLRGSSLIKTFTDAAQTDTVKGGFTQKTGGIHSIESGSASIATKGSTGITAGGGFNVLATGNITETILNASIPPASAARDTLALFGNIDFNATVGSINLDCGRIPLTPGGTGLLSSLSLTPSGVTMSALTPGISKLDLSAAGISLSYLAGLASISLGPTGIKLEYGASSIEVGVTGVTIKGLLNSNEASGINTVKGSLVQLN